MEMGMVIGWTTEFCMRVDDYLFIYMSTIIDRGSLYQEVLRWRNEHSGHGLSGERQREREGFTSGAVLSEAVDDEGNARETSFRSGLLRPLDYLLAGEDEYVKRERIPMLMEPVLFSKAREPVNEALGCLFRNCGKNRTVGARRQETLNGGPCLSLAGYLMQFTIRIDVVLLQQSMDVFDNRLAKNDQQHFHGRRSCDRAKQVTAGLTIVRRVTLDIL